MRQTLILLLIAMSLNAGNFEKGQNAYDNEDYNMAATYWIPLAKSGNIGAQTNLAVMYEEGEGVAQDNAKALFWYQKAAQQGDIDSHCF